MANYLSDATKQQVIALGGLGWTLRRIETATGVRRETASAYLKAAGLAVRPPGRWGHPPPAKPAIEVSTDPGRPSAAEPSPPSWEPRPQRAPAASACVPYRELIESAVARGRNAMATGSFPATRSCPACQIVIFVSDDFANQDVSLFSLR